MREAGIGHVPVVVGGIIPQADHAALHEAGVARVYTPEHYDLDAMMEDLVGVVEESAGVGV